MYPVRAAPRLQERVSMHGLSRRVEAAAAGPAGEQGEDGGRERAQALHARSRGDVSASTQEAVLAHYMLVSGIPAPTREHKFLPDRRFRFDFAWPERKVAVEVEGGTFVSGRHNRPMSMAKDMEKYNLAAIDGWLVLRVTPHQIKSLDALRWIKAALKARPA